MTLMFSRLVAVLCLVALVAGCSVGRAPSSSPEPLESTSPTPVASVSLGPASPAPTPSPTLIDTPPYSPEPSPGCDPPDNPFEHITTDEGREDDEAPEPFWRERDIRALQAYAEENPEQLGGFWIDWETRTLTFSFTADLERHRQRIEEIAPDAPTRIVRARYTEVQQIEVISRVMNDDGFNESIGFRPNFAGYDAIRNIVEATGHACRPQEASAALIERFGADRIEPTVYPLPGPEPEQPQSGEGWRLLTELAAGFSGTNGIRYTDTRADYEAMMAELGIEDPPVVDLERELPVGLVASGGPGDGRGSGPRHPCDWLHLGPIGIDQDARTVIVMIRNPLPTGIGCDSVGRSYTFVIALERDALPERPFVLRGYAPSCAVCSNEVRVR